MSADFPIIAADGGINLEAVVRDGELHLIIGRLDEPGAAELMIAITKLADYVNTLDASVFPHERRAARKELEDAALALWLAGQVAV